MPHIPSYCPLTPLKVDVKSVLLINEKNDRDCAAVSPLSKPPGLRMKTHNTFLEFADDSDDDGSTIQINRAQTWNFAPVAVLKKSSSLAKCVEYGEDDRAISECPTPGEMELPSDAFPNNYCAPPDQKLPTTMMLRNFPRRSPRKSLLAFLDTNGFKGQYDFVYLPFSFEKKRNLGYAFINFCAPEKAFDFYTSWHKRDMFRTGDDGETSKSRLMNISVAQIQGRQANMQRIIKECKVGKITNPKFQPVVYDDMGYRVDFSTVSQNQRAQRCHAARKVKVLGDD